MGFTLHRGFESRPLRFRFQGPGLHSQSGTAVPCPRHQRERPLVNEVGVVLWTVVADASCDGR